MTTLSYGQLIRPDQPKDDETDKPEDDGAAQAEGQQPTLAQ